MRQDVLSVVIPAYNEENNLPKVVAELQKALGAEVIPHEIILVDDSSKDGTARVIAELMCDNPRIRTVTRQPPRGFGRADPRGSGGSPRRCRRHLHG